MIWEATLTIHTDGGEKQIRYFVMPPMIAEDLSAPCYGIGISDGRETHTVAAFCPDKEEAQWVAKMLCRMEVTPISFFEVLDDYLFLQN